MEPENKQDEKSSPAIRTMKSDAELYIKQRLLSPLQVAAKTYASQPMQMPRESKKNTLIVVIIALLALSGGGAALWFFLKPSAPIQQIQEIPKHPPAFIKTENEAIISFLEANPRAFLEKIRIERAKTLAPKSIVYLPIEIEKNGGVKKIAGIAEIIKILGWKPPESFAENLVGQYNLMLLAQKVENDLALIVTVRDFEQLFSSLLFWEKTLPRDWQNFLPADIDIKFLPKTFLDATIKNHDARILMHENRVILGYTIFNKNFLIFATSEKALAEILGRMITVPPVLPK